jgi:hypothetical protein
MPSCTLELAALLNPVVVEFFNFFVPTLRMNAIASSGGTDFFRHILWNKNADIPDKCSQTSSGTASPPQVSIHRRCLKTRILSRASNIETRSNSTTITSKIG